MIYQIRDDIKTLPENCLECKDMRKKMYFTNDINENIQVIHYCYVTDRLIHPESGKRLETCPLRERV